MVQRKQGRDEGQGREGGQGGRGSKIKSARKWEEERKREMQLLREVAAAAKAATTATEEEGKTQTLSVTSFIRRKGPEVRGKEAEEEAASFCWSAGNSLSFS